MTKRLLSLVLTVALLLAVALPVAYAVPSLSYATARLDKAYDVYAGPGTNYRKLGTCGSGGVDRIYGVVSNGWMLLGYQYASGSYRIGYVAPDAYDHLYDIDGSINRSLSFSGSHSVTLVRDITMTDDPIIGGKVIAKFVSGDTATLLATLGSNWAYIEAIYNGSAIRGFVRSFAVSDFVTPAPTTAPRPTNPPVTNPPYTYPPYTTPTQRPYTTPTPTRRPYTTATPAPSGLNARLSAIRHNCTSSGKMMPAAFSPYQTSYLLTMANTVSYVRLTPVAYQSGAYITVNGQQVASGAQSQRIYMTNEPQAVTINVSYGGENTAYTVFLQRRPDTRRTRVSIGFINSIYQSGDDWYINADLATIQYFGEDYANGNLSNYHNSSSSEQYKYVVNPNCIFYYGTITYPYRTTNIHEFIRNYRQYGSNLYRIIYIGGEIVAVMPYAADSGVGAIK